VDFSFLSRFSPLQWEFHAECPLPRREGLAHGRYRVTSEGVGADIAPCVDVSEKHQRSKLTPFGANGVGHQQGRDVIVRYGPGKQKADFGRLFCTLPRVSWANPCSLLGFTVLSR
jgi:hypothetical protein